MRIKFSLIIIIIFIQFNSSYSQKFEKISESILNNQLELNHNCLSYKDGKVAIISNVATDVLRFSIGYLKLTDTTGTTYFEKYIKSEEDTLKMNLYDLKFKDNEIEVLCRKTLDFSEGKFDSYFFGSRLNLLRFDQEGNETFNNLDTNDSTSTFWSLFYLTYNNSGNPICLYTPKTYGTIDINSQFNQYDSDGNLEKIKIISKYETGDSLIFFSTKYRVGKNGNYYAVGTDSYKGINGSNIFSGIIYKVNSNLELEWKKRFENENVFNEIFFYDLHELKNGNIVAFSNYGQFLLNSDGELLNRFEIKSNIQGKKIINGRILQNSDGDLIVSGYNFNESNSKQISYLARIDIEGNVKWEKSFESSNNSRIIDMISYKENHYLFLEYQNSSNKLNLYKYSEVITNIEAQQSTNINIFPNPAEEDITISNSMLINSIEILELNGKKIISNKNLVPQMEQSIKIDYLNPGTYLIRLNDNLYKKFVKE